MRIAINGTGVAGATLAWWLRHYGHEPVLFEKAPHLRTGGYMIDFWGVGYDVAEKMGLLPALHEKGYHMRAVRMVNARGRTTGSLNVDRLRPMLRGRFLSIARGDIAAALFHACAGVEAHFGDSTVALHEHADGVTVRTAQGKEQRFDLVIGADGLHSTIRTLVFGPETQFARDLGFYVAAFTLPGYLPREELAYVSHAEPKMEVARVALRDGSTLFLFIFRAELLEGSDAAADPKTILRRVFGNMQWETPTILARMDEAEEIYFDHVSQIRMERWTQGRAALVGDAGACVSFLAGEGTGLAMTEAYVLAGELHRAGGNYAAAFERYEQLLRPFLATKQKTVKSFAGFFAPPSWFRIRMRDLGLRVSSLPGLTRWFIWRTLRDEFVLPEYGT